MLKKIKVEDINVSLINKLVVNTPSVNTKHFAVFKITKVSYPIEDVVDYGVQKN